MFYNKIKNNMVEVSYSICVETSIESDLCLRKFIIRFLLLYSFFWRFFRCLYRKHSTLLTQINIFSWIPCDNAFRTAYSLLRAMTTDRLKLIIQKMVIWYEAMSMLFAFLYNANSKSYNKINTHFNTRIDFKNNLLEIKYIFW